jgi:hypothetical protein
VRSGDPRRAPDCGERLEQRGCKARVGARVPADLGERLQDEAVEARLVRDDDRSGSDSHRETSSVLSTGFPYGSG